MKFSYLFLMPFSLLLPITSKGQQLTIKEIQVQKKILIQIEHKWVRSYVNRDTVFLKSLLSEDAVFINTHGSVSGTREEINEVSSGSVIYQLFDTFNVTPTIYNNSAVVTAWSHLKAEVKATGRKIDVKFRALDVFIRKNGKWRLVATQATELGPGIN